MASRLLQELDGLRFALDSRNSRKRMLEIRQNGRPRLLGPDGEIRDVDDEDLHMFMLMDERCTKRDVDEDEEVKKAANTRDFTQKVYATAAGKLKVQRAAEAKKAQKQMSADTAHRRVEEIEQEIAEKKEKGERRLRNAFDEKWAGKNLSDAKASFSTGTIVKWILLGLIILGPMLGGFFGVAIQSTGMPLGVQLAGVGVGYIAGTAIPVVLYVRKTKHSAERSVEDKRSEKSSDEQKLQKDIAAAKEAVDKQSETKLVAAKNKAEALDKEIAALNEEIQACQSDLYAITKEPAFTSVIDVLELNLSEEQKLDGALVVEVLKKGQEIGQVIYERAYDQFMEEARQEMLAAQQQDFETWQADEMLLKLKKNYAEAQQAVIEAAHIKSADAVLSEHDMDNIDRIMEKLETGRASTLSEALNIIDAEDLSNSQHEQQMNAMEKHNRRVEEAKQKEAEERARLEKERMRQAQIEADKMQALKERELAMQEEHNAKIQAEERRRTEANNQANAERLKQEEEKLRLQAERDAWEREAREKEVAAAEAAAFHQQEQKEIAAAAAAEAQAAREEEAKANEQRIYANVVRCSNCRYNPRNDMFSPEPDWICSHSGIRCGDDACPRFVHR